ncbi:MAG: hypothetical protein AABX63_01380 [Nanoarchaeota archaeon]
MKIEIIRIDAEIKKKIYEEHSILSEEIEKVLKEDEAIFKKTGGNQIIAMGLYSRYITIYFRYEKKTKQAIITTAYPSSKKQIKHYNKIRKK